MQGRITLGKLTTTRSNYYGARYYNPRTSIWLNVDPLAEKFAGRSPYEYTFSNPINLVDPDGREPVDDHYNKYGKFIGRDNKASKNVIIHIGKGEYRLSQLDYKDPGTRKVVARVLAGYGSLKKTLANSIGVAPSPKSGAFSKGNSIFFQTTALENGIYDNIYNIRSTLNHENLHFKESALTDDGYTFQKHVDVFIWQKLSTPTSKERLRSTK